MSTEMERKVLVNKLIANFQEWTLTSWKPSEDMLQALEEYLVFFSPKDIRDVNYIKQSLIFVINERLELNRKVYRYFIDQAAKKGEIFNYHQKLEIEEAINRPEINFNEWVSDIFKHHQHLEYLLILATEVETEKNRDFIDLDKLLKEKEKYINIIESIFCSYIFYCVSEDTIHKAVNKNCQERYFENYWEHLKYFHSKQVARDQGLSIIDVDNFFDELQDYDRLLSQLIDKITKIYDELTNHCYLAIIIGDKFSCKWSLIADITIFCEKFLERPIDRTYFRWQEVERQTIDYIKNLDRKTCEFQKGNEGFTYKDCYLVYIDQQEKSVLLFEKNERDETLIPCPKCRTFKVQGNSYPILGVRSFECKNLFCGDKSKYNRGKRYSLASIIRQQAILDNRNIIPKEILKKWRRDIVKTSSIADIFLFLIKSYSLYGDTVVIYSNQESLENEIFGRNIKSQSSYFIYNEILDNKLAKEYRELSFFKRFICDQEHEKQCLISNLSKVPWVTLYQGDAFHVLHQLNSESIGGAVTSPPYYNAREYSQWSNIYCYLYDMYNISKEVFRCLKHGSPYLFNIFDYFDNENIIVFSDMGKKRIILSSYISFIFRHIGFTHLGNIAWDKGEIEGNRNFNQGNDSPYYQAPLNCWEHILIFSKGYPSFDLSKLPKVIQEKPVTKMVGGKNIYGHSAPFPEALPKLLFSIVPSEDIILDPFAGSMTTGRVAARESRASINIELHQHYCDLSLNLLNTQISKPLQGSLFDTEIFCN
ncbi:MULTISPECIES: DNA-methyltransferase [Planktothrix]|jgi:DNA modification methylase|uniref:DNA-methyltransferase n=1 Tax=Planktothrix TaxID=54304 RepID=UPI000425587F|nr:MULTISPECIES: site-specific DNA-methyltransferase [Planktothrix]CAD5977011.1 Modification methylase BslI [Planktothrix agardhii]